MGRFHIPLLLLLLAAGPSLAHGVSHEVAREGAVVVTLTAHGGAPLAHAGAEVFAPGSHEVFLDGATDDLGRLVFLPNVDGDWRIVVHTDDGHGLSTTITVDSHDLVSGPRSTASGLDRTVRGLAGIAAIAAGTFLLLRVLRPKP